MDDIHNLFPNLGSLKELPVVWWGLDVTNPADDDFPVGHVTFEFFGNKNPGFIPDELRNMKEYSIRVIGFGEYIQNGILLNQGLLVELPEELQSFYKNEAMPHITVYCSTREDENGKRLTSSKNTRYCSWEVYPPEKQYELLGRIYGALWDPTWQMP